MKILITGNIGYVGSVLVEYLRLKYPTYYICGFDTGFFSKPPFSIRFCPNKLNPVTINVIVIINLTIIIESSYL